MNNEGKQAIRVEEGNIVINLPDMRAFKILRAHEIEARPQNVLIFKNAIEALNYSQSLKNHKGMLAQRLAEQIDVLALEAFAEEGARA
jgi:hypothetical protein